VVALLIFAMSFSYQYGANPPIDYPRFLCSDTVQNDPATGQRVYAFEDSEITMAARIEMAVWMSPQFFTPPAGNAVINNPPYPWRRIAANLLDALAANSARLQIIAKLLDVTINPKASDALRAQAQALRTADDNSGAFVIIEQVNDVFSFRDRFWKQVQREQGGGQ
jgi:hypothetical protein